MKRRFRLNRKKAVYYFLALLFNFSVYKYALPLRQDVVSLLRTESCPACYGQNLCTDFYTGQFELEGFSKWTISQLINERNVFFARWRSRNRTVVLKNLGTDKELRIFDSTVCGFSSGGQIWSGDCDPDKSIELMATDLTQHKVDNEGTGMTTLSLNKMKYLPQLTARVDLLKCVAQQSMVDLFVQSALHHVASPNMNNILSITLMNQEPLIATTFTKSAGWPFPDYLGACGRVALFEYIGSPLNAYYSSSWFLRAYFALQLLELARKFSKNKSGLALYPTDWTANNFAVNDRKQIFLVDLENIIVVNQTYIEETKPEDWDVDHAADRFGCKHCFSFSAEDLCKHAHTDHNYHGVCGGLLGSDPYSPGIAGGLLHNTPRDVLARHPMLPNLIDQCWQSSKPGAREESALLMMEIFRSELDDIDVQKLS